MIVTYLYRHAANEDVYHVNTTESCDLKLIKRGG